MELKIGGLAKKGGVNIQTVRYYERRGLLSPTGRMESGYRLYNEEALKRLKFIRNSKELGFTLKEAEELLNLQVDSTLKCGDVKKKAEEKLMEIIKKVEGLQSMQKVLKSLIKSCRDENPTECCPILRGIEEHGENE